MYYKISFVLLCIENLFSQNLFSQLIPVHEIWLLVTIKKHNKTEHLLYFLWHVLSDCKNKIKQLKKLKS